VASFLDVCRFTAASSGTGSFVVSAAVTGYQTPASANAVDGATYRYRAESADLSQWEVGYGVYTSGTVTLTRATVLFNSSGGASAINFTAAPQVAVVLLAEDLVFINPPQGRLTLATATPVMSSTQSAKTTIYYAPYVGNQIPIYDGVSFRNAAFSELSVATTDTTKSPAAIGASKVNDWFVWDDAGTLRIGHGPDWTSDTARSAGTALVMVNGIWLNNANITNGPAASRGTYVGTTRSNSSSQLDFIFPTTHGTAGLIGIWNAYNRVLLPVRVSDGTASWTYTTASVRQVNGSAVNQISFVSGLAEDAVEGSFNIATTLSAVVAAYKEYSVAMDSTTVTAGTAAIQNGVAVAAQFSASVRYAWSPQLGYHYIAALELGDGANNNTTFGQKYMSLVGTLKY